MTRCQEPYGSTEMMTGRQYPVVLLRSMWHYDGDADVVESVYTTDLKNDLSASVEMPGVELLKFGES